MSYNSSPARLSTLLYQELWPVWTLRALLSQRRWWRLRIPCAAARTRIEHLYSASSQVLPVWRTQPYGEVRLIHLGSSPTSHVKTDNPGYPLIGTVLLLLVLRSLILAPPLVIPTRTRPATSVSERAM